MSPCKNALQWNLLRDLRIFSLSSGGQFCLCPETGEIKTQSCKCQMLVREKLLSFLSLLCAWEAGELRDCRQNRAVLSNVTTVMARNQAASWQVSPCYSISSAAYKRGIFFLLYFFFTRERPALSMCLMNSWFLQRGCWHSCQLTPFVMHTNDYKVFTQANQHMDFHSLLS